MNRYYRAFRYTIVLLAIFAAGSAAQAATSVTFAVSANTDDADQLADGTTYVTDGASYFAGHVGYRFQNVTIPSGATITSATLEVVSLNSGTTSFSVDIMAQDADNAPTFTTAAYNISSRPRTTNQVLWAPGSQSYSTAVPFTSPDFAPVIQEVVDRSGWSPGNSLVVILTPNSGDKSIYKYSGAPVHAPRLHVTYTTDSLVGHWKLNETFGTVAADSAGGGLDGIYVNSPALGEDALHTRGVRFEADSAHDRVALPHTAIDGRTAVTVSWWMKTTKTGQQSILSGARSSSNNAFLIFFASDTRPRLYVDGTNRGLKIESIANGRWTHFVVTHDRTSGAAEFFVNGESVGTMSFPIASGGYSIDPDGLVLAEEQDSVNGNYVTSQAFEGTLDEVQIYNRVLNASEVRLLYGLVGHWKFNEGTGTDIADSSEAGNNASFNNGSPTWVEGIRGYALEFDGTNDAVTGAVFDPPEVGAVAMWIRRDGPSSQIQRPWGISDGFEMRQTADGLMYCDISVTGNQPDFHTDTPLNAANTWYHIVAQFDSDTDAFEIYINGKLHKSGVSSFDLTKQPANLLTFGTRTGSSQRFRGTLDDFRVYSRWLDATEVAELYGLIGHWKLDEDTGSIATDSSGIGNHGAYQGGTAPGGNGPYPGQGANAAEFEGGSGDKIALPEMDYNFSDGFAMSAWYNPAALTGVYTDFFSLSNGPLVDDIWFGLDNTKGLDLFLSDTADGAAFRGLIENETPETDTWQHAVAVVDGAGNATLYRNGVVVATGYVGAPRLTSRANNGIGGTTFGHNIEGHLHDIRLYNRRITPAEVAEIYGLVAHWKLDETSGSIANDSSGMDHHAILTGTQGWTSGNVDGGHAFDYTDGEDYFTAPTSIVLNNLQTSDYSIVAYFKPNSMPPGSGSANDAMYAPLSKEGYHTGLVYEETGRFFNEHWLASGPTWTGSGAWSESHSAGAFYHLVGVVSIDEGWTKFYLNGELKETVNFTPGATTWDYGATPWRIGISEPNATTWGHACDGVIDDARLYNRALSDEEILKLFQAGEVSGLRITRWVETR